MAVVVDHQTSNMRSIKERSDEKLMSTDISRASDAFSGNHQLRRDHSDGETKVTQVRTTIFYEGIFCEVQNHVQTEESLTIIVY